MKYRLVLSPVVGVLIALSSPARGAPTLGSAPCIDPKTGKEFSDVVGAAKGGKDIAEKLGPKSPGITETPPGLTRTETRDLWHLSEGSDVFPYAWMTHLKSSLSSEKGSRFLEDLDKKFGVIKDVDPGKYPVGWVGLGGAWSDESPVRKPGEASSKSELVLGPDQQPKDLEGVRLTSDRHKSIAMVGVNCSFCHTGQVTYKGKSWGIQGAPAMLSLRAFFQDMAGSTAATMLQPDALEEFLKSFNYQGDAHAKAEEFSKDLKVKLGLATDNETAQGLKDTIASIWSKVEPRSFNETKKKTVVKAFFEGRKVMADKMVELLTLTYGFKNKAEVPQTLKLRMNWLAALLGADPSIPNTPEGFHRTDAFGRIANWVARTEQPIPLTANTSLPSIWGIKYRDLFHWNANTNSVEERNLGQSFGLGAILTHPEVPESDPRHFSSTSNLHNLHEIEQLVYKIQVPNWSDYFGPVKMKPALRGCAIYQKTCVKCHEAKPERVGPAKVLMDYPMLSLAEIGTDPTHTVNQAVPVGTVPFRDALFGFARKVREQYYADNQVPLEQQKQWEGRAVRGEEVFRDTYLGLPQFEQGNELSYVNTPPGSGYPARHLAGKWATPPYLHNGSVPNLWELLSPAAKRPKTFFVGSKEYDVEHLGFQSDTSIIPDYAAFKKEFDERYSNGVIRPEQLREREIRTVCAKFETRCMNTTLPGNSNSGHEGPLYGTTLGIEEKRDLLEFMKILAPEKEYSWKKAPLYHIENGECKAN